MNHNFHLREHEGGRKEQAARAEHHRSIHRACAQESVSVHRAAGWRGCRHRAVREWFGRSKGAENRLDVTTQEDAPGAAPSCPW